MRGRQQWFTYTTLANTCRQNIEITQILALAGKQTFMEIELAPAFQFQSSAQENCVGWDCDGIGLGLVAFHIRFAISLQLSSSICAIFAMVCQTPFVQIVNA